MLSATLKPKTCANCGKSFTPRSSFHSVCKPACLLKQINREERQKKAEAKIKNSHERAQFRARKEKLKRIPDLIKEAQTAFNAFIRERDRDQPCICCGNPLGTSEVGGAYDCGHYRSRGSASHLRFDEDNAHAQTKRCNRHGAGRAVDYRIGLIARIGIERVLRLEASNVPHKWERGELIAIRAQYVEKLKELKRSRG
jgi:predicted RNA-binding Zn-ribbon protein involved in translation (DUF1610 family)